MSHLKSLNMELSYDPAIPLLSIYPEELKAGAQANAFTPTVMAVLFIITKRGKESMCPPTD